MCILYTCTLTLINPPLLEGAWCTYCRKGSTLFQRKSNRGPRSSPLPSGLLLSSAVIKGFYFSPLKSLPAHARDWCTYSNRSLFASLLFSACLLLLLHQTKVKSLELSLSVRLFVPFFSSYQKFFFYISKT